MSNAKRAMGVGIIGCGNISAIYLENVPKHDVLRLVGCADLEMSRAEARASEFGTTAYTVQELLSNPEVEIIINLTIPAAHAEVARQAVEAEKHVYNEKPLALSRDQARSFLQRAEAQQLRVGGAPDTFLGGGLQTCRKLIDDGWIGTPVAATAFMLNHGHEHWHPDPAFYYQRGGGPLYDMGPYYLTALISLLGPVSRVSGASRTSFPERTISSKPKFGTRIQVEVATHVAGLLEFGQGSIATLVTSFDVWSAQVPRLEIYGTTGSLSLPDPNNFGGPVQLRRAGATEWREIPLSHGYLENSRGLGVADMAAAILANQPHRASAELTYHVLDVMASIEEAAESGQRVVLESNCPLPAALPLGLVEGVWG